MTSFKGFLAVSLFFASIVAANGSTAGSSFDWSHDPVVSGSTIIVKVLVSPCHPVTVSIMVNGQTVTGTISEAPGECTLKVPEGTSSMPYTIEVRCPDDSTSETGVVL